MTSAEDVISYQLWFIQLAALLLGVILCVVGTARMRASTTNRSVAEVAAALLLPTLSITASGVVFSAIAKLSYAIVARSGVLMGEALLVAFGWLAVIGALALAVTLLAARSARRRAPSADAPHASQGRCSL